MGKRGPLPKTDAERMLEGNPSKRPLKGNPPRPGTGAPTCPSWLSPEAKAEWHRLAPQLAKLGLLTGVDRALFAAYCTTYAWWRRAQEVLAEQGSVYITVRGKLETRPEVEIVRLAGEQMKTLAAEFGLTPVSRARLRLTGQAQGPLDPLEELLREVEKGGQK